MQRCFDENSGMYSFPTVKDLKGINTKYSITYRVSKKPELSMFLTKEKKILYGFEA